MIEQYQVIPGAEAFYLEGNEIGILLSHGFMGTPQSVRFVGEKLAEKGFTVYAPRLKGHGTHYLDMEKCTHEEWYESFEEGYRMLKERGKRVVVMGQSMGGTLALKLASEYPDLAGIITINAALTIPSLEYLRDIFSTRLIAEGAPDIKAKDVFEITYDKVPVRSVHQIQDLMEQIPSRLRMIKAPAMFMKSAVDHVVPPENSSYICKYVSSTTKQLVTLKDSYHVATMDNDKAAIVEKAAQFIGKYVNSRTRLYVGE